MATVAIRPGASTPSLGMGQCDCCLQWVATPKRVANHHNLRANLNQVSTSPPGLPKACLQVPWHLLEHFWQPSPRPTQKSQSGAVQRSSDPSEALQAPLGSTPSHPAPVRVARRIVPPARPHGRRRRRRVHTRASGRPSPAETQMDDQAFKRRPLGTAPFTGHVPTREHQGSILKHELGTQTTSGQQLSQQSRSTA